MANVGKLTVELAASTAKFQADLGKAAAIAEQQSRRMDRAFSSIKGGLLALGGAVGVGAVFAEFKGALDAADKLQDLSERTGETVENLNGLDYAFSIAGASSEDLEAGIRKLSKSISEAGTGNKELKQLFSDLGLENAAQGIGTATDALIELADVFPRLAQADKTRVALELLGKSGEALIPALNGGSAALRGMIAEGQQLNPVTSDLAQKANEFNDTLQKISVASKGALLPALESILPALQSLASQFLDARKAGLSFMEAVTGIGLSNPFKTVGQQVNQLSSEIEKLQSLKLEGGVLANGEIEDTKRIDSQIDRLSKLREYFKLQQQTEALALGQGVQSNEGRGRALQPQAQIKLTGTDKVKKGLSDFERDTTKARDILADLNREFESQSASEYEKEMLKLEERILSLNGLSEKQRIALLNEASGIAQRIDAGKKLEEQNKLEIQASKELAEVLQQESDARTAALSAILDSTPTGQLEKQRESMLLLTEAFEQGRVTQQQYVEGTQVVLEANETAADQVTQFWEEAANNMQDAMADGFFDLMQGDLDDIGSSFKKTIDRMVANALAAQLGEKLFGTGTAGGKGGAGGSASGGWIGTLFELFGSSFANGGVMTSGGPLSLSKYANGGVASSPQLALFGEGDTPEAFVPLPDGRSIPVSMKGGGGGVTLVQNFTVAGSVDRAAQQQLAAAAFRGASRAHARNN